MDYYIAFLLGFVIFLVGFISGLKVAYHYIKKEARKLRMEIVKKEE